MYNERKEIFSFKSFFLNLLLVLLLIFLLLFLFPSRWDLEKEISSFKKNNNIETQTILSNNIFSNNIKKMKEAATNYFTNERMPQTVGETKRLTLQEMYDSKLILKIKDSSDNECSPTESYVEITKDVQEYKLKVNLSCNNMTDYIISHLGCYTYCSGEVYKNDIITTTPATVIEESTTYIYR